MKKFWTLPALLALSLVLVGCSGGDKKPDNNPGGKEIVIDGSSTVEPLSAAVAEDFKKKTGTNVSVSASGTSGGFKKFARGEIDVSDASRPILKSEMEACKKEGIEYIEIPVCFDALTVCVNKGNDWVTEMSIDELKKMWEPAAEKKITRWNQVNPKWPDEELTLFGAGTDSGTWDYFTEAVNGKARSCRLDYNRSENDNVLVQGIKGNKHALGFIPYAYYAENEKDLKPLAIRWDRNVTRDAVLPSPENVEKGTYNPLSRPLFVYVSKKSLERPEVKEFVEFYLDNATMLAREIKYLPLTDAAYGMARERLKKQETGTAFGGVPEVGVKVEDLLKRKLHQ